MMIKNKKWTYVTMISISLVYSWFVQFILHDGTLWPAQELGFAVGIISALYREKIESAIRKNTVCIFIVSIVIFIAAAVIYVLRYSGEHDIRTLSSGMYLGRIVMQVAALLIIFSFLIRFRIGNKITLFIGSHLSMYIFVFHGLFIQIAKVKGMEGEGGIAFVLAATICAAIIVDFVIGNVLKKSSVIWKGKM